MIGKIFDKYANYYDYQESPVLYVYSKITNYGVYCWYISICRCNITYHKIHTYSGKCSVFGSLIRIIFEVLHFKKT